MPRLPRGFFEHTLRVGAYEYSLEIYAQAQTHFEWESGRISELPDFTVSLELLRVCVGTNTLALSIIMTARDATKSMQIYSKYIYILLYTYDD